MTIVTSIMAMMPSYTMALTIPYPDIDPVLINLFGIFPIRWYALAYISGIILAWMYAASLLKRPEFWKGDNEGILSAGPPMSREQLDDLIFWSTLGIILGGRLGYVLFYEPNLLFQLSDDPLFGWLPIPKAIMIWTGGMSFHGGFLGVVLAGVLFCRKHGLHWLRVGDLAGCVATLGLLTGRLANFINGELYGRPTDVPWAMVFPYSDGQPRHPSQLYEAFLEGFLLFALLFVLVRTTKILSRPGAAMGVMIAGYGIARFIVEFFREPDEHMPEALQGFLTMGKLLSLPMILIGLFFIIRAYRGPKPVPNITGSNEVSASLEGGKNKENTATARPNDDAQKNGKP